VISFASVAVALLSARHAKRSAAAAERGVSVQERGLQLERNRERRERLEAVKFHGPAWEPVDDGMTGSFTGQRLSGALRNSGLMTATVVGARLDHNGRCAVVRTRCDPPQGGGRWGTRVFVPPQSVLELEADLDGIDLAGDARPSLYMDYEQLGADTGLHGVTVELLRSGSSMAGQAQWRVGRIRVALLP